MLTKAFPKSLSSRVEEVLARLPKSEIPPTDNTIGPILISGENILIPSRIYFPEANLLSLNDLSEVQKGILFCIYTRHNDGQVREKYLRLLLADGILDIWVAPFVVQLIGEYVVEIIVVINSMGDRLKRSPFPEFLRENNKFLELTRERVQSYWDCDYRSAYPQKEDYPGFRAIKEIAGS